MTVPVLHKHWEMFIIFERCMQCEHCLSICHITLTKCGFGWLGRLRGNKKLPGSLPNHPHTALMLCEVVYSRVVWTRPKHCRHCAKIIHTTQCLGGVGTIVCNLHFLHFFYFLHFFHFNKLKKYTQYSNTLIHTLTALF